MAFGLCAAQVLRVPAGHWGVSCAIPWLALIFLCTEWMMRRPNRWALLVGAFAVAMQVLSGMPQYVFITAISAGFYALIRPLGAGRSEGTRTGGPEGTRTGGEPWQGRAERWAMVAGMWLLGAALAAVQLLPGIEAAANGARSLPMLKHWLMVFSLGPECLLTMVVPGFFGGTVDGSFYWGRWLSWEMNAYIGVAALVLAVYALICERPRRTVACFALTACLALLLALGEHTRATDLLALTPLGGMFRGSAKFLLPFSLALSVLAAIGTDRLLSAAPPKLLRFILAACVAGAIALAILLTAPGAVASWQKAVLHTGECLYRYDPNAEATSASALPAVHDGLQALLLLAALVGGYLLFRRKPTAAAWVIFFIVATDAVLFSRGFIGPATTFRAEKSAWPEGAGAALRREGGDRRTWAMGIPEMDDAMLERVPVVEGIEPNPPARFHQLFQIGAEPPGEYRAQHLSPAVARRTGAAADCAGARPGAGGHAGGVVAGARAVARRAVGNPRAAVLRDARAGGLPEPRRAFARGDAGGGARRGPAGDGGSRRGIHAAGLARDRRPHAGRHPRGRPRLTSSSSPNSRSPAGSSCSTIISPAGKPKWTAPRRESCGPTTPSAPSPCPRELTASSSGIAPSRSTGESPSASPRWRRPRSSR